VGAAVVLREGAAATERERRDFVATRLADRAVRGDEGGPGGVAARPLARLRASDVALLEV
jgi:hypothetical protein